MPCFLDSVTDYRSVAIVGMAKNAGKTECLNHLLRMLRSRGVSPCVTSIGIDGENTDAVTRTRKPEITLFEETVFVTSESFYRTRRLTSAILSLGNRATSLGRLVTARTVTPGKVIISGPPDTPSLKRLIADMTDAGVPLTLVDGALSRLSLGSPAVTDALVLATGAALSPSPQIIADKTAFVCEMMRLPEVSTDITEKLGDIDKGVWGIDSDGTPHDLGIPTALALTRHKDRVYSHGKTIFVAGAVTDKLLEFLTSQPQCHETTLIMRDFSCMFATPMNYRLFRAKGGKIEVVRKCNILGICVNPTSPQGYRVDSTNLCDLIEQKTGLPVADIFRQETL